MGGAVAASAVRCSSGTEQRRNLALLTRCKTLIAHLRENRTIIALQGRRRCNHSMFMARKPKPNSRFLSAHHRTFLIAV